MALAECTGLRLPALAGRIFFEMRKYHSPMWGSNLRPLSLAYHVNALLTELLHEVAESSALLETKYAINHNVK